MNERSIFIEALEKDSQAKRSAYLDEVCARDTALRKRVEELLASHVEAGSFLGKPAPERLVEQLAAPTGTHENAGIPPTSDNGQSLGFLTPSNNPGSLGRLGSYEVQEVIGRGGMGIVLRAFDEKLHRVVAIKVMAAPLASNEHARRRFVREGRAAAAIRDDHVIGIYGVDETNGLPFLVMEYIVGRSLAQRIESEGPLPLAEILRIGSQIARGLAAAHSQGVVHRDIKPANILLENSVERVKITDFGLAHAVDDVRTTQPGTVIGTPEYMSPEQARGEKVDHRSDLFSLGCVLYAMCAGRPPFRAESTVAVIRRVCDDTPRPLTEINSDIPGWLVDLIDKLIAKDASERFQSAAEVAELLGQYLAHVQQPAVNPQPVGWDKTRDSRAPAHQRRVGVSPARISRRGWSIAAAILLLLGAGLGMAESTGVTNVAATVIRIVRGDGTLVVEIDDPNIQVLLDGEEVVITGAGPKEIRLRPGQHELQTMKGGKAAETKLITITRDGRQVVKVAREASAAVVPAVPTTRLVWDKAEDVYGLSPDGRYLSFVDWETGDVAVRDLTTGKNRRLTNKGTWFESTEFGLWPRISTDGRQLFYTWYDKQGQADLRVLGLDGGDPRVVYSNKNEEVTPEVCGWMPDGKSILAKLHLEPEASGSGPRAQFAIIGLTDGRTRVIKEIDGDVGAAAALTPDGRTIAYSRITEASTGKQDIFLLDVETGQETPVETHVANKKILAWTPDGQRLLFDMERQEARDAWMIRVAGGKPVGEAELVKKDLGAVVALGITRDGTFHFGPYSRGTSLFTATLDVEKGTAAATPLAAEKFNLTDRLGPGDWSPDGEHLAYSARQRSTTEIRIVAVKTGQMRVLKPDLRYFAFSRLRWSPDGRSFLASGGEPKQGIYQIDAVTGQTTAIVEVRGLNQFVWSSDGQGIIFSRTPYLLGVPNFLARNIPIVFRDLKTKAEREVSTPGDPDFDGKMGFSFEPSPDGRQLALLGKPSDESMVLWLIPASGGASRELLKINAPGAFPGGVRWTPDGRFVLFTQLGGDEAQRGLWFVSADGGEPRKVALTGVNDKQVARLAIHPDGKQLALLAQGTGKSEIWALENFLPPLADSKPPAAADTAKAENK